MISISKSSKRVVRVLFAAFVAALFLLPQLGLAQQALSLSVTPTLFEMTANPKQLWQSQVKVINTNSFDIEVYAEAVNFAPQGERGQGKLIPVFEEMTEGSTLAEWIDITSDPVTIPSESSKQIPFIVEVPEDASPGGHFAAILISTKPPKRQSGAMFVSTTQVVTSLFFVRVAGDVNEHGDIRSFTTREHFVETPQATFELRFENKGNVHLQPRGDITIFNMWGKERGKIPINHKTHFGNVLPDSIRAFEFSWTGEQSFSDFGRYKAVASLGYGSDERRFATSTTYFWVIPIKPLLITLGSVAGFILFVIFAVRLYVRRMLQLAGVPIERARTIDESPDAYTEEEGDVRVRSYRTIAAPVRSGYLDLRRRLEDARAFMDVLRTLASFVGTYKWFFITTFVLLIAVVALIVFFNDVTEEDKSYEVRIENPDTSVDLSSEEVAYEEQAAIRGLPSIGEMGEQPFTLDVVNTSGEEGTAAGEAVRLAERGYRIARIGTGQGRVDTTSIVVFDPALQEEAVAISKLLDGALLSARTASSSEEQLNLTIYVGADQVAE